MFFRIDLKILFFLLVFYFTGQLNLYIVIMIFCFLHECVHIIVAKILGFKIRALELMPFGFFANIEADIKDYNNKFFKSNIVEFKKFFIAIAGPLLNIVLTFIFANIDGDRANVITYSNLLIFIFNLIPIFPLDGGRALNCLLCIFFGRYKASCVINKISNGVIIFLTVVTSLTILYLKNIAMLFILGYLWFLVARENRRFELQKQIYEYLKNE